MGRRANSEGSISRRKDGRWMARFTVETPDGTKRKTLYAKTRKEAADKLTEALAARNSGALTFDSEDLTVGEYLDRWLESIRDSVKPVSWENYERNIRLHLKPALGNVKLAKLTPGRIQALYDKERETHTCRLAQSLEASADVTAGPRERGGSNRETQGPRRRDKATGYRAGEGSA